MNLEDFRSYFNDFIEVNQNPYVISLTEVYKEGGEIKSKKIEKKVYLKEFESPLDLILKNEKIEYLDYYPSGFFSRLFFKRKKITLESDEYDFIFVSKKTSRIINTDCRIFNIPEDNKIVLGRRNLLLALNKDDKSFFWSDESNYKTIVIR